MGPHLTAAPDHEARANGGKLKPNRGDPAPVCLGVTEPESSDSTSDYEPATRQACDDGPHSPVVLTCGNQTLCDSPGRIRHAWRTAGRPTKKRAAPGRITPITSVSQPGWQGTRPRSEYPVLCERGQGGRAFFIAVCEDVSLHRLELIYCRLSSSWPPCDR